MLTDRYGLLMNVCFVAIVAFLALGAVEIPCPYCHGTGKIQMSAVLNSEELAFGKPTITAEGIQMGCSRSDLFQVKVDVTMSNQGQADWSGWVEASVTVAGVAGWNSTAYAKVDVKPGSTRSYTFAVMADLTNLRAQGFWGAPIFETTLQKAQGLILCPICDGTGKITVFTWIITMAGGKGNAP
jgi:hypothetical protein